jgi:myo-inositol-1(or 4)-monophosphatase
MEIRVTERPDLAPFLDRLADAAGKSIMPHFRAAASVEDKGKGRFDPVTIADRAAEEAMRALINAEFPAHGIVGEEFGSERAEVCRAADAHELTCRAGEDSIPGGAG